MQHVTKQPDAKSKHVGHFSQWDLLFLEYFVILKFQGLL